MRIPFALVLSTVLLSVTAPVAAQVWNDGAPSRLQHSCWQGTFPAIVEDLTWTWTGFEGSPVSGAPYRVHIAVGGLGCSGAWVLPQIKLPRNTTLRVDASHPIRCFYERTSTGVVEEITDGSCPTAASLGSYPTSSSFPNADGRNNEFLGFAPTSQPYWPLPPGVILSIEAYVVTTGTLSGIATNDYLLGAVQVLDNSPGNPTVVDDGHPPGYLGGSIPSSGPWQGVFVFPSASLAPRIAYPQPITVDVTETTATTRAVVFNTGCLSPRQVRFNLLYPDLVTDPPGSGFAGGSCSPNGDGSDSCVASWTGLRAGTTYAFQATFDPATLGACPAPEGDDLWQLFTTAAPPGVERHAVLLRNEGAGTATLEPPGGNYTVGTVVTITATPSAGESLVRFVVDGSPVTTNPLTLTADADHDVVAEFSSGSGGTDGGSEDAGASDGGVGADGGSVDASTADGGSPPAPSGGCRASGAADGSAFAWIVVAAFALSSRRRLGRLTHRSGRRGARSTRRS